jgi:hypothetical protein
VTHISAYVAGWSLHLPVKDGGCDGPTPPCAFRLVTFPLTSHDHVHDGGYLFIGPPVCLCVLQLTLSAASSIASRGWWPWAALTCQRHSLCGDGLAREAFAERW